MRELFGHCETMLRKEETYLDGAALLAEVLDVPGYRQHADLMWLPVGFWKRHVTWT